MRHDILTENQAEAMVAGDTFDILVDRVTRMATAERNMVLSAREATYTGRPAKVSGGWRLDVAARSGGIWIERKTASDGALRSGVCGVVLTNGGDGFDDQAGFVFGESFGRGSGNTTEAEAWQRYRAHCAEHDDPFQRRRNMTLIAFHGGVAGWRYSVRDSITISSWNGDGVCTEIVVGFDHVDGSW